MADQLTTNFLTRTLRKRNAPADYGARVSNDLKLKGVLLDDHHKGVQAKQRRQKKLRRQHLDHQKSLLPRKRRKVIVAEAYSSSNESLTYASLEGLREMWVKYARMRREEIGRLPGNVRVGAGSTRSSKELKQVAEGVEFVKKLVGSLEFHGCELEVVEGDEVVVGGIVVGRGKNSFVMVSKKDEVVRVVKKGKRLRFRLDGHEYGFYGDQVS